MSNVFSVWECQHCGTQCPKWSGQCPDCGKWNTLVEETVNKNEGFASQRGERRTKSEGKRSNNQSKPQSLSEILWKTDTVRQRLSTGIGELDRVLGSGLVPGAVVLLAGEPGMGKSTLLSQVALQLSNVLYICGEESPNQVAMRLKRLMGESLSAFSRAHGRPEGAALRRQHARTRENQTSDSLDATSLFPETNVDSIIAQLEKTKPSLVIVDSIQTMFTSDLTGMAGAVGQIRECAGRLSQAAKQLNIPLFLVGHVTKEGDVAGPKVLEHVVDVVLIIEGERSGALRMVRAVKNRFGPVDEVGLFAMEEGGMREVENPAELLIGEHAGQASGSVLGCVLEGQRPLVLEVQALTVPSKIPVPRRVGQGINERRLQLLCAVIEKHIGLGIGEKDVFVNVAGGLKSQDPGLDLAIVAAIVSSCDSSSTFSRAHGRPEGAALRRQHARPLEKQTSDSQSSHSIFCGEVGLLGEVRMVQGWERREKEIERLKLGRLVGKNTISSIRDLQKYL